MLKRTPLVYMVSRMALICNRYAAGCTKTKAEILRSQNARKEKNAPGKGQKGRNRVRFGCWGGVQPVRTGGETRNPNQNAPDSNAAHEKRKPAKTQCFRRFFGQGQKDLNPRHAVLEWMWENAARSGGGAMFPRFPPQVTKQAVLVWCCGEILRAGSRENGRKIPGKTLAIIPCLSKEVAPLLDDLCTAGFDDFHDIPQGALGKHAI